MQEVQPITVSFFNQLEDHQEAQRLLYRQSVTAKVDKVVAVLLFGFGIWCVMTAGLQWWTVIWFPLALAEWFHLLSPAKLRARLWFRSNPKFQEEYHLTFTPESIHFRTGSVDSTLRWTHYERVLESENLFLLTYGKGLYTLIPKRSFASDAAISAFRTLAHEQID